jgi:hypothetical protein
LVGGRGCRRQDGRRSIRHGHRLHGVEAVHKRC